jgi:hypothetical protein
VQVQHPATVFSTAIHSCGSEVQIIDFGLDFHVPNHNPEPCRLCPTEGYQQEQYITNPPNTSFTYNEDSGALSVIPASA